MSGKRIQPFFDNEQYEIIKKVAKNEGFSNPTELVKHIAIKQIVNPFKEAQNKLNEILK
jgi:hypothetical protein